MRNLLHYAMVTIATFTLFASILFSQNPIHFSTSNLQDWAVFDDRGNQVEPSRVGLCVDPCVIQCICGNTQNFPQETQCQSNTAKAIWGTARHNGKCTYPIDTFYFEYAFQLTDPNIDSIYFSVIADNFFKIWINGTRVIMGRSTDWQTVYTFGNTAYNYRGYNRGNRGGPIAYGSGLDLAKLLRMGPNKIRVEVINVGGAPCMNYAFLSMCGTLFPSKSSDIVIDDEEAWDIFQIINHPDGNNLNIKSKQKIKKVDLFDLRGRLITTTLPFNMATEANLSLSSLAESMYLLNIHLEDGRTYSKKIAVQ